MSSNERLSIVRPEVNEALVRRKKFMAKASPAPKDRFLGGSANGREADLAGLAKIRSFQVSAENRPNVEGAERVRPQTGSKSPVDDSQGLPFSK